MGLLDPIFGDGGAKQAKREAARAREEEQQRRRAISSGISSVRGTFDRQFTGDYYGSLSDAVRGLYQPKLQQGYEDSLRNMTYGLARNNMLGSAVRNQFEDRLRRENAEGAMAIDDQANQFVAQRRTEVANSLDGLIAQVQAGVDPGAVAGMAAARVAAVDARPAYQPMGQFFTDTTNAMATQADLERRQMARYPTGWFAPSSGSSATVVGKGSGS